MGIMDSFVERCRLYYLQLNTSKTKELVVDFSRWKTPPTPVSIQGVDVDTVQDYRYVGVHLDSKLDWAKDTEAVHKRGQNQVYFRWRLHSFNVCSTVLRMFYQSVVASAIFFAVVCWGSRVRAVYANRINKLTRKGGSVLGEDAAQIEHHG